MNLDRFLLLNGILAAPSKAFQRVWAKDTTFLFYFMKECQIFL